MWLLLSLFFQPPASPSQITRQLDAITEETLYADAVWGIHVVAPLRGDKVIYSKNAGRNFRPASNTKIVTTLMGFEFLGGEYRFQTRFAYSGVLRDGKLDGDLYIIAGGDPSFSGNYQAGTTEQLLDALVLQLKDRGLQQVKGDLIAVTGFFSEETLHPSWEWFDIGLSYGVPSSPLSINDGLYSIHLSSNADNNVTISSEPPGDLIMIDQLTHDASAPLKLDFQRRWGTDVIVLKGNLPPCSDKSLRAAAWNPNRHFLLGLRHALALHDVPVTGGTREQIDEPEGLSHLSTWLSPPLSELSIELMHRSENHYATSVFRTIGAELSGEGSFEASAHWADQLIADAVNDPKYAKGQAMIDGSGMSSWHYFKPVQLTSLLAFGLAAPYQEEWLATFPEMGAQGTLERRGEVYPDVKGRVWAKTGYINRTRTLSGYLETQAGEPLIFSIMLNNYSCSFAEANRVQDRICALLTQLKPSRTVRRQKQALFPFSRP